jgi:ribonuclease-3
LTNLKALQQVLGIQFRDLSLLQQALVHSSYVNENPGAALTSNERLEFLGDAILALVVAQKIYDDYPFFSEGEMTRLRSALVRRTSLANIARTISLGDYIYLGKGEEASGGCNKPANLANTMESVIAAIFLDQGQDAARDFIIRLIDTELKKLVSQGTRIDYKSQLQHFSQFKYKETPVYQIIEATGPSHDRRFTAEVRVGETVLGKGSGKSKKLAETEAARIALEHSNNFTQ